MPSSDSNADSNSNSNQYSITNFHADTFRDADSDYYTNSNQYSHSDCNFNSAAVLRGTLFSRN